ncbi:VanZ family protein [Anatilimnocola floriformis]|uniref:VanZ family protein n=1 Tax=Anatilimnocola floriformis TaxID=2948575 RepID=UPI0020C48C4E|nr:VanZ family protein [Anatilimnocola floriformis]
MSTFDPPYAKPAHAFRSRLFLLSLVAGAWWTLQFIATHVPIALPGAANSLDKYQHSSAFCVLTILLCSAYETWRPRREWGYFGVFLLVIAYGGLDEWTQSFVGRHSDVLDWFADFGGSACGVGLMFFVAAFWRRSAAASDAASAAVSTR